MAIEDSIGQDVYNPVYITFQGITLLNEQLQQEGLAVFELADTSGLDKACEVVIELKALQKQQKRVETVADIEMPWPGPMIDRHMDIQVLQDLFFDANLQAAAAENFGTDLFLWRSNFFYKHQGDRDGRGTGENKWHHDRHFENGAAPLDIFNMSNHFTVLLALTDVGMNAGRLEYVKGSHQPIDGWDRDIPRHIKEVPEVVQDRVTPLPLKRGQFVLFHSSLLHRSLAFESGDARISMAARLAKVGTEFPEDGAANPAGGEQSRAEPIVNYRKTGILAFN